MILRVLLIVVLDVSVSVLAAPNAVPDAGYFWHVTDMHWDPTFRDWGGSCKEKGPAARGTYGEFDCDAPLALLQNAVGAIKALKPDPDFLIWTGDDTPHIYNDTLLNKEVVYNIIDNLTAILETNFPNTTVFSALGNHDWSPKSQLPGGPDPLYGRIADRWSQWLEAPDASVTFRKGGYYTARSPLTELRVVVLNTNLYYDSNKAMKDKQDPAEQLKWLDELLLKTKEENGKVMIIAHVPPGVFEKHRNKHWFYPDQNKAFLGLLRKHSGIIGSTHFGHHHTDTFRVFRDEKGSPLLSMLLAPAVSPWETTLPGVIGGAGNNPSVRLVEYNRRTGEILNLQQYYLNLTEANVNGPCWKLEYDARDYYKVKDFGTQSLHNLAERLKTDKDLFQKYYRANGVLYDPSEVCGGQCWHIHYCAITQLQYEPYEDCVKNMENGTAAGKILNVPLLIVTVTLLLLGYHQQ